MISAFVKGIQQLSDRNTRKPLWISIGSALSVFAALWGVAFVLFKYTALFDILWLETIADWLGAVVILILTWALFPGVVSAVVALFLDQVAEQVERLHYPDLPAAQGQPVSEQISTALRFLGLVVLLNLLILPFMLLGPAYPLLYYTVNGYLLGREYFEMIAARRMGQRDVVMLRRDHSSGLFLAGVVIAFLLTIPIVNLLTPVIATAAMVHLFMGYGGAQGGGGAAGKEAAGGLPTARAGNSMLDGTGRDA